MGPRKHYFPLESNPDLFTQLIHRLGVSPSLVFQDVLSINDPDLLAFVARPALALVLVFPTSEVYEQQKATDEASRRQYEAYGEGEQVMFFKQTINNACGLYGILHAVSNGDARELIGKFVFFLPNILLVNNTKCLDLVNQFGATLTCSTMATPTPTCKHR